MALTLYYKIFSTDATEKLFPSKKTTPNHKRRPLSLLFLHGYFASHTNMIGILGYFRELYKQKHVHFYLIDIRNHGHSPHNDNTSYEAMAEDIEAIIKLENLHDTVLIGHSMGGKIAMTIATRERISIKKLIIGDIAPCKYAQAHSEQHIARLSKLRLSDFSSRSAVNEHLAQTMPNATLRNFFLKNLRHKTSFTSNSQEQVSQPSTHFTNSQELTSQTHLANSREPNDLTSQTSHTSQTSTEPVKMPTQSSQLYWQCNFPILYKKRSEIIKAVPPPKKPLSSYIKNLPVLFMRGETSPYLDAQAQKTLPMYFPAYILKTLPNTGHWLHYEQPEKFAQTSHAFIENRSFL
ncbi:esterase YbfF [Spirochaetota bacterium]|nr:esterase YbfF [Spirochaetota bacterium]